MTKVGEGIGSGGDREEQMKRRFKLHQTWLVENEIDLLSCFIVLSVR